MRIILAAGLTLALATPAFAGQCPALMARIDAAMATATATDATKARVTELYAVGKAAHEAGDHPASEAALNEALALLGL